MSSDRLRSIVPMFGGGTRYVETLDGILGFVEAHGPTTDELVGWDCGTFSNMDNDYRKRNETTCVILQSQFIVLVGGVDLLNEVD